MPPLDQFKNMPKEPQLGERDKVEQDNVEYSAPLKVPLADQKSDLMSDLYGSNGNKESFKDVISKLDLDSQYFPNLKTLFESGHIDAETLIKTSEKLEEAKPDEELKIFLNTVNGISDINLRDSMIKGLESKQEINENNFDKTEFAKDSKTLNLDLDQGVGGLELTLARNYISINNVDGTQDKSRDLSKAMDTSLGELLRNSSEDFKKQNGPLISNIKGEKNLDKKYSLLKDLYKEDLKRDAILGGKKSNEEIKRKKTSLIEKAKDISEQIKEAQNIKDDKQKKQEIDRLNLEKEKIITEGKDINGFSDEIAEIEALSGGKNDKTSESKEKRDEN